MNALALPYPTTAPWPGQDDGPEGRRMRGLAIAAVCPIERIRIGYRVPSQSGKGSYVVVQHGGLWMCSCPDYEKRAIDCKHAYAVKYAIQRGDISSNTPATDGASDLADESAVLVPDGPELVTPSAPVRKISDQSVRQSNGPRRGQVTPASSERSRPTYGQNWPAYNLAQRNEKAHFRYLLRDLAALSENPKTGTGRPSPSLPDKIFSLVYKTYTGLSWRRFDTDLREAREGGFIKTAAGTSSLARYMDDQELTPILHDLVLCSALPLRPFETSFSADATGFSTSQFDRWFTEKWGNENGKDAGSRDWVKLHLICGNSTHIITCAEVSDWRDHDSRYFEPLVSETAEFFDVQSVAADKAYLSRKSLAFVDGLGATMFSPFKSNTVAPRLNDNSAWAKMYYQCMSDYDGWASHYHQRSNVETAFSMIKAKFGDAVSSKNVVAQANEICCKVVAHNLVCLVHAMYERGIEPEFAPLS